MLAKVGDLGPQTSTSAQVFRSKQLEACKRRTRNIWSEGQMQEHTKLGWLMYKDILDGNSV